MVYYSETDQYIHTIENMRAHITFRSDQDFKEYSFYFDGPSLTVSTIPAGTYYVSGTLSSPDFQTLHGAFTYIYTIAEDTDTIHIYIPTASSIDPITDDTERMLKIGELSQVLDECGIGPVTDTAYTQEESCHKVLT